ncbi:glycosyltransferase family 4 protein [Chitinivorax sp. PXF-14]|uniref:glycosyltransferase family 4 protein n=1 Tax=Chitinivorax sp. PXF-14 TaxID=3230488 RepID=UPI0034663E7F
MTPPHALLVISSLGRGGAERVICELASALGEQGLTVTLLTLDDSKDDYYPLSPKVERKCSNIMWESNGLFSRLSSATKRLWRMRTVVKSSQPDIVISFIDTTNIRTLLALVGSGIPIIVSERTDPRHHEIGRFWRALRRISYPLAARVVVQTPQVAAWAKAAIPSAKIETIPNAVRLFPTDTQRERPAAMPPGRIVLGIGRLGTEKGFDRLLYAFAASTLRESNWSVVILGEGSEREPLTRLAEELGIADKLVLAGMQLQPEKWLIYADLFVLSSRYEGFPNVLIEAMQSGVPSIAFDCQSGPADIIHHGVDGWLVPNDNIEALSDALTKLSNDNALRAQLGQAAKSIADRLSPQIVYRHWGDLCHSLIRYRRLRLR